MTTEAMFCKKCGTKMKYNYIPAEKMTWWDGNNRYRRGEKFCSRTGGRQYMLRYECPNYRKYLGFIPNRHSVIDKPETVKTF